MKLGISSNSGDFYFCNFFSENFSSFSSMSSHSFWSMSLFILFSPPSIYLVSASCSFSLQQIIFQNFIITIITIINVIILFIICYLQHRNMLNGCLARKLVITNNQSFSFWSFSFISVLVLFPVFVLSLIMCFLCCM